VRTVHFGFSEDQRDIRQNARELLAKRVDPAQRREPARLGALGLGLFAELAEHGWPGMALDERYGGTGLGLVELATLVEEHGYALAPSPLLGTVCAAAVIGAAGTMEQKDTWLPGLATGAIRGAFGSADLIPDGLGTDIVVVLDGGAALIVDPAQVLPVATIDSTRRYARCRNRRPARNCPAMSVRVYRRPPLWSPPS